MYLAEGVIEKPTDYFASYTSDSRVLVLLSSRGRSFSVPRLASKAVELDASDLRVFGAMARRRGGRRLKSLPALLVAENGHLLSVGGQSL